MVVERPRDAVSFLRAAGTFLLEDEARNNLALGIAGSLRDHPGVYDDHRLWLVRDRGRVVGAALRTPPYNLVLPGPTSDETLETLAVALQRGSEALPGVTGAVPEVERFASCWSVLAGVRRRRRMAQHIYRLETLRQPSGIPGRARTASRADRSLLVDWVTAFAHEAAADDAPVHAAERVVDARLRHGAGGFAIWEDGGPVSLAGWGGTTPNGVRVGPVYTPPEHRGRGYGTAVTASVSSDALASGRRFCFLYTDAANATSNRIYVRIGYEHVCESVDFVFVHDAAS